MMRTKQTVVVATTVVRNSDAQALLILQEILESLG